MTSSKVNISRMSRISHFNKKGGCMKLFTILAISLLFCICPAYSQTPDGETPEVECPCWKEQTILEINREMHLERVHCLSSIIGVAEWITPFCDWDRPALTLICDNFHGRGVPFYVWEISAETSFGERRCTNAIEPQHRQVVPKAEPQRVEKMGLSEREYQKCASDVLWLKSEQCKSEP